MLVTVLQIDDAHNKAQVFFYYVFLFYHTDHYLEYTMFQVMNGNDNKGRLFKAWGNFFFFLLFSSSSYFTHSSSSSDQNQIWMTLIRTRPRHEGDDLDDLELLVLSF